MSKIALITGSSRGIGRDLAIKLVDKGYRVFVSARDEKALNSLSDDVNKSGLINCKSIDLLDSNKVISYINNVLDVGVPDLVVHNLGLYLEDAFDSETSHLDLLLNTNLKVAVQITKLLLPHLKKRNTGHFFTICSLLSKKARREALSYTISKHALRGFHKVLVEELKDSLVKATAIFPGPVNTSSWSGLDVPREEFIQPSDISSSIINLLDNSNYSFVNELDIYSKNSIF